MKFNFLIPRSPVWPAVVALTLFLVSPTFCRSLEETIERHFDTGPEPEVRLRSFNGEIVVRRGPDNAVRARLTKHVYRLTGLGAEHALDSIEVKMQQEGDRIEIEATGPHHRMFLKCTGSFLEVEVPANARVFAETSNAPIGTEGLQHFQSLKTSDGRVVVDDARGEVQVESTNGPLEIELEDATFQGRTSNAKVDIESERSQIDVTTSNGAIEVSMDGGSIKARTSSGHVEIHGEADRAEVETSNGRIVVDLGSSPVHLNARTSNGSIEFEGHPVGTSLLRTSNGRIFAEVPDEEPLWIEASTTHGQIETEVNFDHIEMQKEGRLLARVGDRPENRLILETSNGSIEIE